MDQSAEDLQRDRIKFLAVFLRERKYPKWNEELNTFSYSKTLIIHSIYMDITKIHAQSTIDCARIT